MDRAARRPGALCAGRRGGLPVTAQGRLALLLAALGLAACQPALKGPGESGQTVYYGLRPGAGSPVTTDLAP